MLLLPALLLALAPGDVKLAAPGLHVTGMDPALAEALNEHLAQSFEGVRVVTPRDIATLLGLERQKQLLGCSEAAASCMVELSNALGVNGVVLGDLVKLGDVIQMNLRIIDPISGKKLASVSERANSDSAVLDVLTRAGRGLQGQVFDALGVQQVVKSRPWWVPLAIGGVLAAVGAGLAFGALDAHTKLTSGAARTLTLGQAQTLAGTGGTLQTLSAVSFGLAGAAVVASIVLLLLPKEPATAAWLDVAGALFAGVQP